MFDPSEPLAFLEHCLSELIDGARPALKEHLAQLGRIEVAVTDRTGIDAYSEKVARRRRILSGPAYKITVHRGLSEFCRDIGDLLTARSEVVSESGDVKAPPDLTHEQAASALKESIESYVRFGRWDMSSPLILATYTRHMRQQENPDEPPKSLMLSMWMDMTVFAVAHELSHILVGHCDRPAPTTIQERWQEEFEADEVAAGLLGGYHYRRIGSPSLSEMTEAERQRFAVSSSGATIAVAVLFELFCLFTEFARMIGVNWRSHPPGDRRYQRFRTYDIQRLGRREEVFTRGVGLGAPDSVRALFRELAVELSHE